MNDDTIRLATIGRLFRRRWRLLAVLTALGALAGLGVSLLLPPRYTASASVLLAGQWEKRELQTQAELATSSAVLDRAAALLDRPQVSGSELRERVDAEVTDGNIVKISGTAGTPGDAQRLADRVAGEYVAFAVRLASDTADPEAATRPEELRKTVMRTSRRITDLAEAADPGRSVESVQGRTELAELRVALLDAMKKLEEAGPALTRADMVVLGPADRPDGEAPPTRLQLILAGAALFFLVTLVRQLTAGRTSRRPRSETEIAGALGSVPLGTVDVPAGRSGRSAGARGARARMRWLLGTDVPWDVPAPRASGNEAARRLRYRRVCERLRDRVPFTGRGLLVVVPGGDEVARRAAALLVDEAGGDPVLRVVEVAPDLPTLPDGDRESGAVVVLGSGSRTADELAGLAGACADAGHEIVGVVVAGPVRTGRGAGTGQPAVPVPAAGGARGGTA